TLAEAIKPLRATYRSAMAKLIDQRQTLAAPLYDAYDRALAAYQDELTRATQLDEAARIKAVRAHVASLREASGKPLASPGAPTVATVSPPGLGVGDKADAVAVPVAPPLPASQVLPPLPKASQDDIRALVDWMFRVKDNWISVAEGPVSRQIRQSADLPRGNLKVVGLNLNLDNLAEDPEIPKYLATVGGLTDLEDLRLSFSRYSKGPLALETLRGLTKLKALTLSGLFDDSGFPHLIGLKALTDVRILGRGFTGTGLGYLGTGIETLDFTGETHLTAEGLAYLPRFQKLRILKCGQCPNLRDEMLGSLGYLPELETFEVHQTAVDGSFLTHLAGHPKLKSLTMHSTPKFQPDHLVHLGSLKSLESVTLPPLDPPAEVLASLAKIGNLSSLQFSPPFNGESLAGVTGFRALTSLRILDCPISNAGWAAIAEAMPELKSIQFSRPKDSKAPESFAAMGEHLGRLKNLTFVEAGSSGITDDWMTAIGRLKGLTSFHVSSPLVTDAGLLQIRDLPLTALRINGTAISDASVPTLKGFPNLISGYIYFPSGMSPAGIAEVKDYLDNQKK
ncbi:MAG: hypothetical protein KDM64_08450, partial [Verrucomicrobiae bacterium]|nr:hypothetical protein [Verrucomicrobiae bacterium]